MYTIIWSGRALDQLAAIYVALPLDEQRRVADVINAFNHRLAQDPLGEGESRGTNARIAFPTGLIVRFRVDPAGQSVRVVSIWRTSR